MSVTFSAKFDSLTGAPNFAREVGKYHVLAELGRGGMANVYLAALRGKSEVNKLVVLKALLPEIASEPEALTMFLDEARLATLLNHGNVVQTYEVGLEGERHVMVMEYLDGQSLASILRKAQKHEAAVPLALHLRVLIDTLEGLHYAHEVKGYDGKPLQLVHRDVSPQNVFVTYDGRTKLLDFGIAKAATSTTHTATGILKGKIAYMAPEQLSGDDVDRRADVYAVGCMLWAAATGRKMWKSVPDTLILRKAQAGDIPLPHLVNPECDETLSRIVMTALATDREQRYATARELQDELEGYAEQKGLTARPRELAAFVSSLFAENQIELNTQIEQQLALLSQASGLPALEATRPVGPEVTENQHTASSMRTISASTLNNGAESRPPTKRAPWLAGLGLLAAAIGLAAFVSRSPRATTSQAVTATGPSAQSRTVEVKPTNVRIELRASPSDARLFLDDEPLAGNPALRVLPNDAKVHQLRAELAGHQTASAEFTAQRDEMIELRLDALNAAPPSSASSARSTRRAPKRPVAAKPNCSQPFFVDADGIKKVKPGCL